MTVIYFLILCSLILAIFFLGAFFWSVKSGQTEDLTGPAYRMLFDDEPEKNEKNNTLKSQ